MRAAGCIVRDAERPASCSAAGWRKHYTDCATGSGSDTHPAVVRLSEVTTDSDIRNRYYPAADIGQSDGLRPAGAPLWLTEEIEAGRRQTHSGSVNQCRGVFYCSAPTGSRHYGKSDKGCDQQKHGLD